MENSANSDTISHKGRPVEILLVEDNVGDVILTKKAFKKAKLPNNITVAEDGDKAIQFLRRDDRGNAPMPDIILLDLNLPKKNGQEVLKEIKSDERLKKIPVIVLTSSSAELDVVKSYNLHANSYLVKPVTLDKFVDIVKTLEEFWFSSAILPESVQQGEA